MRTGQQRKSGGEGRGEAMRERETSGGESERKE